MAKIVPLVDKRVSYYGSRQVILTGVVVAESNGFYEVRDDSSGIIHNIHPDQILRAGEKLI